MEVAILCLNKKQESEIAVRQYVRVNRFPCPRRGDSGHWVDLLSYPFIPIHWTLSELDIINRRHLLGLGGSTTDPLL